jgi:hypothetical protein
MDDVGMPLPLAYVVDGKHSEITETKEKESSGGNENGIIRRKILTIIGSPLPLEYIKQEKDDEIFEKNEIKENENQEEETKEMEDEKEEDEKRIGIEEDQQKKVKNEVRKQHIKLSDLGNPLPLDYMTSNEVSLNDEFNMHNIVGVNDFSHLKGKYKNEIEKPIRTIKFYDFGAPLPLDYLNKEVITGFTTEENASSEIPIAELKQVQEGKNNKLENVIDHKIENNINTELLESMQKNDRFESNDKNEPIDMTDLTVLQNIEQLVKTQNTIELQNRINEDADFRLQLIRYTRQVKKQYEYLCSILNMNSKLDQGETEQKHFGLILHPLVVALFVVISLCSLSYILAD